MEIYYFKKNSPFAFGYAQRHPTKSELRRHYRKLPIKIPYDHTLSKNQNLERAYSILNSDTINPLSTPTYQRWILQSGVGHTSMSMGDIVKIGKDFYIVEDVGFEKIDMVEMDACCPKCGAPVLFSSYVDGSRAYAQDKAECKSCGWSIKLLN